MRSRSFIQEIEHSTRSLLVGDDASDVGTISIEAIRVEPVAFSTTTSTRTTVTTTTKMLATSTNTVGSADTSLTTLLSSSIAPATMTPTDDVLSGAEGRLNAIGVMILYGSFVVAVSP